MKTRFTVGARVRRCPLLWSDAEFGPEVNCGEVLALLSQHGRVTDAIVRFDDGRESTYAVGTLQLLPVDEEACVERSFKREEAAAPRRLSPKPKKSDNWGY